MRGAIELLRAEGRFAAGGAAQDYAPIAALLLAASGLYGASLATYSGDARQMVYSAAKVPLLLAASTLVCLPNFYVVNALLGLREQFGAAVKALLAAQAALGLCLLSFAPVIVFLSLTLRDYELLKLANGALFVAASLAAQLLLRRHYAPLIAASRRHRVALVLWPVLYVFVAMQLAYTLRPFLGAPYLRVEFLREDALQNVYLELVWLCRRRSSRRRAAGSCR
jgi:hypothetical protein